MKGVAKGFFKTLAVAAVLAALAWSGTLLYWHFTLRAAVETLERRSIGVDTARRKLMSGGCRSLPYVVHSLDREGGDRWQWEVLYRLLLSTSTQEAFPVDGESGSIINFLEGCFVDPEPTPEKLVAWRRRIQAWWQESGSSHHQWWRVWSSSCRLGSRRLFRE